jgi:hypothetical protein
VLIRFHPWLKTLRLCAFAVENAMRLLRLLAAMILFVSFVYFVV